MKLALIISIFFFSISASSYGNNIQVLLDKNSEIQMRGGSTGTEGGGDMTSHLVREEILAIERDILKKLPILLTDLSFTEDRVKLLEVKEYLTKKDLIKPTYDTLKVNGQIAEAKTKYSSKISFYNIAAWEQLSSCQKEQLVLHENFIRVELEKSFKYNYSSSLKYRLMHCHFEIHETCHETISHIVSATKLATKRINKCLDSKINYLKNKTNFNDYLFHQDRVKEIASQLSNITKTCNSICKLITKEENYCQVLNSEQQQLYSNSYQNCAKPLN